MSYLYSSPVVIETVAGDFIDGVRQREAHFSEYNELCLQGGWSVCQILVLVNFYQLINC